ncbi:MAG: adenine phosphoribosyltransferase [Planctomycetota bacterium]|jgi:adenine phosphoribosyltransferase|nr:adenine phosphoribosyltransferase [Planctomycetota bacterium]
MEIASHIRSVPDFPRPGIVFKDLTPVMGDPVLFRRAVDWLSDRFGTSGAAKVCAAEARGFIFAAALAYKLGWGMAPIRKPDKLPWRSIRESYDLEYGSATLCLHEDAVKPGERVLLVDDLLATGGTAAAMIRLVERLGGEVAGLGFIVELDFLRGRDVLAGRRVESLVHVGRE